MNRQPFGGWKGSGSSGKNAGGYYYVAPSVPQAADLRDIKIQVPLQVYSRDGRLLAEFGEMKRMPVEYENIPPLLIKAILAAEDEHFFEHPGVDYRGVIRGVLNELSPNGSTVGGSTITQQVTRTLNVLQRSGLSSGVQRFVQKFKEWILAFRIEREFTKQEILELYLNRVYFGAGAYGIEAASQRFEGATQYSLGFQTKHLRRDRIEQRHPLVLVDTDHAEML